MRGSWIAKQIEIDQRKEKALKEKAIRRQCIINNVKQCNICSYKNICRDR